jgi:hypothetical protein
MPQFWPFTNYSFFKDIFSIYSNLNLMKSLDSAALALLIGGGIESVALLIGSEMNKVSWSITRNAK